MIRGITCIFIILFSSLILRSQDTLVLKKGTPLVVKVSTIESELIKYKRLDMADGPLYSIYTKDVLKIKYFDGTEKVLEEPVKIDPTFTSKPDIIKEDTVLRKTFFIKLNLTNIILNQASVAFEKRLSKKNSFEFEANYNFASPSGNYSDWKYNLHYNEEGFEIKPGLARTLVEFRKSSFLAGVNVSYRYSHISNAIFMAPFSSKITDVGVYRMSQTRNVGGLFLKLTYRLRYRKSGFDFFLQPGGYIGHNKNTYFEYKPEINGSNQVWRTTDIPPLTTWYMKNGLAMLPYINFGIALRIRTPERGETIRLFKGYEKDTAYKARNIFKFQLTSLLACKIAFTYERVFNYKYSWEFEPAYIFLNPVYDGASNLFFPNTAFKNEGFEIITGFNVLDIETHGKSPKSRSHGLFISYRYQHSDNINYWTGGMSGKGYHYSYDISQTKNLMSLFYKRNLFHVKKKVGMDFFYAFGFYTGMARTVCFYYSGNYGSDRGTPMTTYNPSGLVFSNGFVFMPFARVGLAIRFNKHNIK